MQIEYKLSYDNDYDNATYSRSHFQRSFSV